MEPQQGGTHMKISLTSRVRRATVMLTAGAVLSVALAGQGTTATPVHAQSILHPAFFGQIPGTDALIGIVSDGNRIAAYFCDSQYNAAWFRAEISSVSAGNSIELRSNTGAFLRIEASSLNAGLASETSSVNVRGQLSSAAPRSSGPSKSRRRSATPVSSAPMPSRVTGWLPPAGS